MNKIANFLNKKIYYQNITEKFFTKKKIILTIIFIIVFLVSIGISFWGLKIDPIKIWNLFIDTFEKYPLSLLFIFLIILYPITRFLYVISYIRPMMIKNNINLSWLEYLTLFLKVWILNVITPFSSGSEPYVIYWLKSRGLTLNEANRVTIINGFAFGIVEILITIPSFISVSLKYELVTSTTFGTYLYWFIFAGIIINLIVLSTYIIFGFSSRMQYLLSIISNWILMKFRKKHLTKAEIHNKYITNKDFIKELIITLKDYKYIIPIFISYAFTTIYYYCTLYFSIQSLNLGVDYSKFFLEIFNSINVGITANNFIPIPGAEGTIQVTIISLSNMLNTNLSFDQIYINNVVGFWRIMTTYFPLIISLMWCLFYYLMKIYFIKNNLSNQNNVLIKK